MRTVNVHQAKSTLSSLLAEVETTRGTVVICRNGKPVAELRPFARTGRRTTPHPDTRGVVLHGDPVEPLAPEDWGECV